MVELGRIVQQIRGVSYKPEDLHNSLDQNSIPLLRANNIRDGEINLEDVIFVDRSRVKDIQILRAGDILICTSSGSKELVGKAAFVRNDIHATFGAFCKVVRPTSGLAPYIGHYFQSPTYRRSISALASGANINNIRNEHIDGLMINLPDEDIQQVIIEKLDLVSNLISYHNLQIITLEKLIKSRFIEMFGDPSLNPKAWSVVNIASIVEGKVSNGFFAKRDAYCEDGNVQVLGVANIVNRMYSNIEGLPKTNATQTDIAKYGVGYGDMLFCRSSLVAEGIGKASIVPRCAPKNVLFECHVIRLPLNLNICIPEFIQVLSTTDFFRQQIIAQSKTATMTTIGQDGILSANIILPPLDLQHQFLSFVEQTDKLKLEVKQSLKKLETLKKALMQAYFG